MSSQVPPALNRNRIGRLWLRGAACVGLVLSLIGAAEPGAFEVVVHPDNPTTSVSRDELSKLFLKRVTTWRHGELTKPVDQVRDREIRRLFFREVHQQTPERIEYYWQRQIFSGQDVPPPDLASDEEILAFVASHPGAVGYVAAGTADDRVRVLQVIF